MNHRLRNYVLLALMLTSSGLAVALRPSHETNRSGPKVELGVLVPDHFGEWSIDKSVVPVMPAPELQEVIEQTYDQTLARTYVNAEGRRIMLSIAYGGDYGKKDMQTHRPEVCYPAQGFQVRDKSTVRLTTPYSTFNVTHLTAYQGVRNEPITYWIVVGGEQTDFGMALRFAQLKHGLTGRVPDGMLVRVSSIDRDEAGAFALQNAFVNQMFDAMPPEARKRLTGKVN